MSSLSQMIDLLRPTGLYRLSDDSHIMQELRAYAAGLDRLEAAFSEMIREAFVQTAEGYGLEYYERLLELAHLEGDTDARRRRLCGLLFLSEDDFTPAAMVGSLAALGAQVNITEDHTGEKLTITGKGYTGAGKDAADIIRELSLVLPAHLGYDLSINIGSWYYWDSRGLTFSHWDQLARSFADHAASAMLNATDE